MMVNRCNLLSEFLCFQDGDLARQKRSPSLLLSDLKIGYVDHHQFYVPVNSEVTGLSVLLRIEGI